MNWGTGITLGGAAVGMAILAHHLGGWYPGWKTLRKDWLGQVAALLPFVLAWCYGTALLMCAGGLVRLLTDLTVWGTSWTGDAILVWGVGGQWSDHVPERDVQYLTNGGHVIVVVLTGLVIGLYKRGKVDTGSLARGTFCGVLVGQTGGVLGVAAIPVASSLNVAGAWISTGIGGA